ncbi:MAG: hypothetical protein ACOCXX_04350 [Planctomycetota bacterium]
MNGEWKVLKIRGELSLCYTQANVGRRRLGDWRNRAISNWYFNMNLQKQEGGRRAIDYVARALGYEWTGDMAAEMNAVTSEPVARLKLNAMAHRLNEVGCTFNVPGVPPQYTVNFGEGAP